MPFSVFASVFDVTSDGDLVAGKTISLALYAFNDTIPPIDRSTGKVDIPSAPVQARALASFSHVGIHREVGMFLFIHNRGGAVAMRVYPAHVR